MITGWYQCAQNNCLGVILYYFLYFSEISNTRVSSSSVCSMLKRACIYGILGCYSYCKSTWWTQDLFSHVYSTILVNCDSVHHLAQALVYCIALIFCGSKILRKAVFDIFIENNFAKTLSTLTLVGARCYASRHDSMGGAY